MATCDECSQPRHTDGLCIKHLYKFRVTGVRGGEFLGNSGHHMPPGDPRLSQGSRHHMWKGDNVGYFAAHYRVRKSRGSASSCVFGCSASRYYWANLTGNHHDTDDYAPMCGSCHIRFDQARRSMEPDFKVNGGWPQRIRSRRRS